MKRSAETQEQEPKAESKLARKNGSSSDAASLAMLEHLAPQSPWREVLSKEWSKAYIRELDNRLSEERRKHTIFPKPQDVFACLNFTPPLEVRVVILGQDPYHGPGQAHGFCFSVNRGVAVPPSLKNIYSELEEDVPGFVRPSHGLWGAEKRGSREGRSVVQSYESASRENWHWVERRKGQ